MNPNSQTSPQNHPPRPLTAYQLWTWSAILASALVCMLAAWLHFAQQQALQQMTASITTMHLARIELSKGFLYVMLAEEANSPFNRDEGLALLQQAADSLEAAATASGAAAPLADVADFQQSLASFQALLLDYRAASAPQPRLEAELRIAFHDLETHAAAVDFQSQQQLQALRAKFDLEYGLTLAGATVLLLGVCGVMVYTGQVKGKTDAALRESQANFATIFERGPVAIGISRLRDGKITHLNTAFAEFLGFTRDEALGRTTTELEIWAQPADRQRFTEQLQSDRQVRNFESVARLKSGELRQVLVSGELVTIGGEPSLMAQIVDITERKLAEAAAQKSHEQLMKLASQVPGMLYQFEMKPDGTFRVPFTNDAIQEIFGCSPEAVREDFSPVANVIHPDDLPGVYQAIEVSARDVTPFRAEYRVLLPGQPARWTLAQSTPEKFPDGSIIWSGFNTDITERKQFEQKLRESETRYRLIAENTADVIWVLDPIARKFTYVSPAVQKLRGYTPEEVLAQPVEQALTPESLKLVSDSLAANLPAFMARGSGTMSYVNEVDQPCKDGTLVQTEVTTTYLFNERGQVEIVGVSRNITERKRAEQELKRWADIFQNVSFGFVVSSPEDRLLGIMNPAFARMHGYSMDELPGTPIVNVFAPEDRAALPEHIRLTHATGHHAWEARHLRKDGTLFPVMIEAVAVKDETGKILYRIVSVQDISERKQAEAQRARLAERLELATRSAQVGIWDWDIQKNEVVWDDQMYALYSLQPGEFGGAYEAWLKGIHPEDRESGNAVSAAAVRGEREYDTEFRVLWPDGSVHWLKAVGQVFRDETGKPLRMVGVNFDITERKLAEEQLRASEAKFKAVFDNAPVGISLLDAERNLLESNDMLAQVVRMEKTKLVFGDYRKRKYIREDGSEIPVSELASARAIAEHRAIRDVLNGIVLEDGEIIWTQVSAAPLGSDDPRFVVITQDVTRRKRIEDELRHSNAELEQFAYVASHDLQEPLRTVAGMVQLLQQRYQGQLDERADEYIHFAVDASERMQKLINDLLEFSRVARQGRPFETTNLEQVLKIAQANLCSAITESGASLTHDPLPTVQADAGQLTQVLQNLIGNAIKFRGERPLEIHISAEKVERGWQLAVRDNGIGIEPQYFERVFLLFQRLHTRRKYPGTGIGLALCKKIIERHGGKMWVESELNHGATFFFTLPERASS